MSEFYDDYPVSSYDPYKNVMMVPQDDYDTLRRALEKACEHAMNTNYGCPQSDGLIDSKEACATCFIYTDVGVRQDAVMKCWTAYFMDDSE